MYINLLLCRMLLDQLVESSSSTHAKQNIRITPQSNVEVKCDERRLRMKSTNRMFSFNHNKQTKYWEDHMSYKLSRIPDKPMCVRTHQQFHYKTLRADKYSTYYVHF